MGNSVITGMRLLQFGFSDHCLKSSNGQPTEQHEVLLGGAHLQVMSRQIDTSDYEQRQGMEEAEGKSKQVKFPRKNN